MPHAAGVGARGRTPEGPRPPVPIFPRIMLGRPRTLPTGFIAPCLPTKTDKLPSGSDWLHEIKHDGFRIIARKNRAQVRLYSRPGNDFTRRFPLIVDALSRLRSRSCIIDGEAVACDDNGVVSFDLVRHHRANESIFLYAFDLIELTGQRSSRRSAGTNVPAGTLALVRSLLALRCSREQNALHTLIHQRHLTPSCRGQALLRREPWTRQGCSRRA
jgi:ATP dependent DNA ligase domain